MSVCVSRMNVHIKENKTQTQTHYQKKKKSLWREHLLCLPRKAHKHCKVTLDQMALAASLGSILSLCHNVCNYLNMQFKEWWLKSSYKPSTEEKT